MTPRNCLHADREDAGDGARVRCLSCGRVFVPRRAPTLHGTYRGYSFHLKRRQGEWAWPPCPPCAEAGREYRQDYEASPRAQKMRRQRGAARAEALARLRRQHPGEYAQAYFEGLRLRGEEEVRQHYEVPAWDDAIARIVLLATGFDEASADGRVSRRQAGPKESEIIRQARKLRVILARLTSQRRAEGFRDI